MADAGKKVVEKVLNQFGDTPIEAIPAETVNRGREALERILEEYGSMPIKLLNSTTFKDELRDAFPGTADADVPFQLRSVLPSLRVHASGRLPLHRPCGSAESGRNQ